MLLTGPVAGNPDPTGERVKAVRRALAEQPHIEAFFWDFPSLFQNPRSREQDAAFKRALKVVRVMALELCANAHLLCDSPCEARISASMDHTWHWCVQMGDLYASAIGTTVLQLKELPVRPTEYDGALGLFDLAEGVDEAKIRAALDGVVSVELGAWPPAVVRFATHAAAIDAKQALARLTHVCGGIDTLYNERPYDERGWCVFESAASSELIVRLQSYPKMHAALEALPPKMLGLSTTEPTKAVELQSGALATRVKDETARIERTTFTGKGDKPVVIDMYKNYVGRIATALQKTLALSGTATQMMMALPPPAVVVPAATPLQLADGQPLLLLVQGEGGSTRFGVVDHGRIICTIAGGDAELTFDGCSQAVLPWRPSLSPGWEEALLRDVKALHAFDVRMRQLDATIFAAKAEMFGAEAEARVQSVAVEAARVSEAAQAPMIKKVGEAIQSRAKDALKALGDQLKALGDQPDADSKMSQASLALLQSLRNELSQLQPEALAAAALRAAGGNGVRRYRSGQWLTVRMAKGQWVDAEVAEEGSVVVLDSRAVHLHPWNHAVRELPQSAFEKVCAWWKKDVLYRQHSSIYDALTGKPLRVLDQTVPIDVVDDVELAGIQNALDLADRLMKLHTERCLGLATDDISAMLLEGPPASGKTCLMSQLVMRVVDVEETVPIVIKVQQLQRRLLESPGAFAKACNWIDAYLRLEHDEPVYRMLRQAMMARRALLLLDGLDEGGKLRNKIERHVAEELAPQGHVMLVTSRPAGLDKVHRFAGFRQLKLLPLTLEQQAKVLEERLGADGAQKLQLYIETMPTDTETGLRVTSNPLMLSMVASVFELRQGIEMPSTIAALYATASDAMLARGGAVLDQLRTLLQRVFFEAHVAQRRVIEDRQLDEAALGLAAPEALEAIRAAHAPFGFKGRAEKGHYVEVMEGKHAGMRGVIIEDDRTWLNVRSGDPYKVTFTGGAVSDWLKPNQLRSSGLDEAAFFKHEAERSSAIESEVRVACEAKLPEAVHAALVEVRRRVICDELPLLSLLQAEPLQLQSSHLSFQEYFAASALCEEGAILSGAPPYQWPAWWANAVTLGAEMGDTFRRGLLRASGVTDNTLDLSQKLGGDRPTVLRVVVELSATITDLNLTGNDIGNDIGNDTAKAIAEALQSGTTALTECSLLKNDLGVNSATMLAKIGTEKRIMLSGMKRNQTAASFYSEGLKPADAIFIASDLPFMSAITDLNLSGNKIGSDGAKAIAEALQSGITTITSLNLSDNYLDPEAGKALAEALQSGITATLTDINLASNRLGPLGAAAIADALKLNTSLTECTLIMNNLDVDSATMLAKIGTEKRIMLSGMKRDQTEADFSDHGLSAADGILIASDLPFITALTVIECASRA